MFIGAEVMCCSTKECEVEDPYAADGVFTCFSSEECAFSYHYFLNP